MRAIDDAHHVLQDVYDPSSEHEIKEGTRSVESHNLTYLDQVDNPGCLVLNGNDHVYRRVLQAKERSHRVSKAQACRQGDATRLNITGLATHLFPG